MHVEAVADFSQQGYHILCEKPMATTVQDCIAMIRDISALPTPKVFGMGHGTFHSFRFAISQLLTSCSSPLFALQQSNQGRDHVRRTR